MKTTVLLIVKWLMTTASFLLVVGACIVGASFLASYYTGQWHWFQRSGALMVSIGVILSTRRLLRVGLEGLILRSSYFEIVASVETNRDDTQVLETKRDLISAYWGFVVVGIGNVVWAHGDLIECLIAQNMNCVS